MSNIKEKLIELDTLRKQLDKIETFLIGNGRLIIETGKNKFSLFKNFGPAAHHLEIYDLELRDEIMMVLENRHMYIKNEIESFFKNENEVTQ